MSSADFSSQSFDTSHQPLDILLVPLEKCLAASASRAQQIQKIRTKYHHDQPDTPSAVDKVAHVEHEEKTAPQKKE